MTALLESGHPDVLAVKSGFLLGDEEMKVETDAAGRIEDFRKAERDVLPLLPLLKT